MQIKENRWIVQMAAAVLALVLLAACGDDDDDSNGDTGGSGGTDAVAGSGGAEAGSGGTGGGGSGGSGGSEPAGGSGGNGFSMDGGFPFGAECSEPEPTDPVVCGGETCTVETTSSFFGGTSCIYPCCFSQDGSEVCGARDTTVDNSVACQPPPEPDTRCPDYTGGNSDADAGGFGTDLPGCCTPDNKCGVISSMRPLCITSSQLIELPATPQACDAN